MKFSNAIGSALFLICVACGGAPAQTAEGANTAKTDAPAANGTEHAPATAPSGPVSKTAMKAPGEATIGDTSTCPISKEEFTITASSPKADYKGKTYYFCCAGCETKFNADPAKYVADASKK